MSLAVSIAQQAAAEGSPASDVRRWRLAALFLIAAAPSAHLLFLACRCPLDLAPDEAHYWDWSRHLDWSYYSKGPLVAWLIRLSVAFFGDWSRALTGTDMVAVRLPAVVSGALLLVGLYRLTMLVYQDERLAFGVVAFGLTLPIVSAGSTLMTIDAPYTCCWGWALVFGYYAVFQGAAWAWPAAGLAVGLGILSKYTMVLWLPSIALFLAMSPPHRYQLRRRGFWIMIALAGACTLPIIYWNWRHDWVSLRHVGGQAGLDDARLRWHGPLEYLGAQCALFLIFWFLAWVRAMIAYRPSLQADAGTQYLWWMAAPTFLFFLVFSLKTPEEPNWPVAAYLSGMVLTAAWLRQILTGPNSFDRRINKFGLVAASLVGIMITLTMHHSEWVRPVLGWLSGPAAPDRPLPLRRFDPTCRLRGWHFLAQEIDRLREELVRAGEEPLLAADGWNMPGEIGFYCKGHPAVYCFGAVMGDRHSQHELWHPNPVSEPYQFAGRTFITVGESWAKLAWAFDRIERPQEVLYQEDGHPIASWKITVCRGFRGFLPGADDEAAGRY
jgi:hypothetical protein